VNADDTPDRAAASTADVIRAGIIQDVREAWEEAATAHIVDRVRQGGARAREGLERRAVDAVRSRSGLIRRLLLMAV